jgi:polysaccharide export outer membrane protein
MNFFKCLFFLFSIVLTLILGSCKTREKIVYFTKNEIDSTLNMNNLYYTPKLKIDDLLSIIVTDNDKESVEPFNSSVTATAQSGYLNGTNQLNGYLIDRSGMVNLPVIGKIKIAGLFRDEAVNLIENELKKYLNNPVVQLSILNFKVTVLGEVQSPGTFRIPNERITLLEAIGLAGDLKITGVRKNVLVIRESDGKKEEFRVDLTSKNLYNSPVYYLNQNDVVYIEPNKASISNSTFVRTNGSLIVSITSLIISTLILINR